MPARPSINTVWLCGPDHLRGSPSRKDGSSSGRYPQNTLEEPFEQPDSALLPRHPVRDARGVLEVLEVVQVPAEVPEERLLVRELRRVAELPLRLLYGDEGVLGGRLVDPLVEGGDAEAVEYAQPDDGWGGGEADYLLAVPGLV